MTDPMVTHIHNIGRRGVIFVILTGAQATAFWIWLWTTFKEMNAIEAVRSVANAWPVRLDSFASVALIACVWIAFGNTSVLYFLLARWWQKRADVLHRRGARFVDQREGS